jgi:hypothetical protein
VTGPAEGPRRPQPGGPTSNERTFLYANFGQFQSPDTWAADAVYPADSPDSPVPYTLTAKAEALLGQAGCPTSPLRKGHACGMRTRPLRARPALSGQPRTYITEISVPQYDSGIYRLHVRMTEPEPEPEAGQ